MKRSIAFLTLAFFIPLGAMQSATPSVAPTTIINAGQQAITSVAFIDHNRFAAGSENGTVSIFDTIHGNEIRKIFVNGPVKAIAISPPNILYVATENLNYPLFFNYENGQSLGAGHVNQGGHTSPITALSVIDPQSVITASYEGTLVVLQSSMTSRTLHTQEGIQSLAIVNPNLVLSTSDLSSYIYMINPKSGAIQKLPIPAGYTHPLSLAVLSPTRWAIGLTNGRIIILDSTTGRNEMRILEGTNLAKNLATINATYLASNNGQDVSIWNAQTSQKALTLIAQSSASLTSVAASVSGQTVHIIASDSAGKINFWKLTLAQIAGQGSSQQQQSQQKKQAAAATSEGRPSVNPEAYKALGVIDDAPPTSILGVSKNATSAEIRKAYIDLAAIWHPDKNPKPLAKDAFLLIQWAYDQLKSKP